MVRNKVALAKYFHIQPSEIERMPFWEYELSLEEVNKIIEKENEENSGSKHGATDNYQPPKNINDIQRMGRQMGINTPKMPNMNNFKMPKI